MADNMIDLQNVTKTYAKNGFKAVDDLTLQVKGGELFGFIGPNGAGKTTTIKLMTGILRADAGTITMAGSLMALSIKRLRKPVYPFPVALAFARDSGEMRMATTGFFCSSRRALAIRAISAYCSGV